MASEKKKSGKAESDVQGHGGAKTDTKVIAASTEDDVEGHYLGHNAMISNNAAQNREREIQHHLRDHETKTQARRPFFKRGK